MVQKRGRNIVKHLRIYEHSFSSLPRTSRRNISEDEENKVYGQDPSCNNRRDFARFETQGRGWGILWTQPVMTCRFLGGAPRSYISIRLDETISTRCFAVGSRFRTVLIFDRRWLDGAVFSSFKYAWVPEFLIKPFIRNKKSRVT